MTETDPDLAFMLARQAMNRLQFDLRSLQEAAAAGKEPDFTRSEAEISMNQVEVLADRIRPFTAFIDQAIRFEAQEILIALDGIRHELDRITEQLEPAPTAPGAAEVAARLMRRRA